MTGRTNAISFMSGGEWRLINFQHSSSKAVVEPGIRKNFEIQIDEDAYGILISNAYSGGEYYNGDITVVLFDFPPTSNELKIIIDSNAAADSEAADLIYNDGILFGSLSQPTSSSKAYYKLLK